jgi:TM2 domain-containing membrane protein YozV
MNPKKSQGMATALALLLGSIGAHKFYLEKAGQGLLYFLFSWTFIPALIGFFEGINYALMSKENWLIEVGSDSESRKYPSQSLSSELRSLESDSNVASISVADELKKLHELHTKGILTEEEFIKRKKKLLAA